MGVIPARLGSVRLPGKPLRKVAGRPLIEWVWRRMEAARVLDELVVAADSPEVVGAVEAFGGRAVLTREGHASGTDRVAEVAARPQFAGYDWVLNLQGDEPFLPEGAEEAVVALLKAGWDVATLAAPIGDRYEWTAASTVKVVRDNEGGALYFSRAAIPYDSRGGGLDPAAMEVPALRHIGVYGFRREALSRAAALPRHPLEDTEKLEQLRWLAAGLRIGVSVVEGGSPGIDTEEDLVRAERLLGGRGKRHE